MNLIIIKSIRKLKTIMSLILDYWNKPKTIYSFVREYFVSVFKYIQHGSDSLNTSKKSAQFISNYLYHIPYFYYRNELLSYSIRQVNIDGLFLEFGVYKGNSINYISSVLPNETIYGFDSFEGLPEDWINGYDKGAFKLENLPEVNKNVTLVKGLFQDSLTSFLNDHHEMVAFIHMDADLYSSTIYVLTTLVNNKRLDNGAVIQFDEFFEYENWWNTGEYKAFTEFVEEFKVKYEYLGYHKGCVTIRITEIMLV